MAWTMRGRVRGDVLRQVAAVGARIADELVVLVEGLGGVEGLLRAEAVEPVGVALQLGEVVERRRRHALRLGFDRLDGRLAGAGPLRDAAGLLAIGGQAHGLLERLLSRASAALAKPGALIRVRLRGARRVKGGHHFAGSPRARRCGWRVRAPPAWPASASARAPPRVLVVSERVGAREVHAHQPVGAAAAAGGVGQADRSRAGLRASKPLRMASGVSEEIQRRRTGLAHCAAS